jgi:hypothetical protein
VEFSDNGLQSKNENQIAVHSFSWCNRSALAITEAELKLIAASAMMGLRANPLRLEYPAHYKQNLMPFSFAFSLNEA